MELKEILEELERDADCKIRQIERSEKDVLKRAYQCAQVITEANIRLKAFIMDYEFRDEQEEIWFFKRAKPALISQFIYYCQVHNAELNRPVGSHDVQRDYLNGELENLQDYADRRPELYCYYRLDSTHNDVLYFTRGKFVLGLQYLEPTLSEREPKYSTNCDYKLAKFIANERLEILLKSQLDELEHPDGISAQLPWMTTKTFLIELLYALDSFKAFGKIPLKHVVAVVQKLLGIDLGNYSAAFAEMRTRNEPTPFLNALREVLLLRMKRKDDKKQKNS